MDDTTTSLDTTVTEPPLDAGEVDTILFSLDRSRAQFAWKVRGLDADALRRAFPPSTMTLGGLVKHLAQVEDEFADLRLRGRRPPERWRAVLDDPDWAFTSAADDDPAELYAGWQQAAERCRAVWRELLADGGGDRLSDWEPEPGMRPSLRRLAADLKEEYARHTGHADLFREAVDGLVGEDPPQD
ncbi:mycothiol transferase [Thalassiella azotivora]